MVQNDTPSLDALLIEPLDGSGSLVVIDDKGLDYDTIERIDGALVISGQDGSRSLILLPDHNDVDPSDIAAIVAVDENGAKRQMVVRAAPGMAP